MTGCASSDRPTSTSVDLSSSQYEIAFQATKDVLRDAGFLLNRISAREGIVTTLPKESSGFWTPWVADESSLSQELEGGLHRQRRIVEVRFETTNKSPADMRTFEGDLSVAVHVKLERVYRFGTQFSPISVRMTSVYHDPELVEIGAQPSFATALGEDEKLAIRLAGKIERAIHKEMLE